MKVVFIPYWGSNNPYQDELAKCIESQGIIVEKVKTLKDVFNQTIFRFDRPDIIHLHWQPSFNLGLSSFAKLILFFLRLFVLRTLKIKIVWTVHNIIPHESKNRKLNIITSGLIARIANSIIVHSKSAKKIIISTFHLRSRKKIFIIPHGNYINSYDNNIDRTAARSNLCISDSKVVVLILGGIRPYKGVLELIGAFRMLSVDQEDLELMIVGQPLDEEFSNTIKDKIKGSKGIIYKPVFVTKDKIQVYMNACDVVVFPYQESLTSGAVILAMSFGKACIAPKLGGLQDVLDNAGAFLYESKDKDGLVNALKLACINKEKLEGMGQYNRHKVLPWSWDFVASETKKVYLDCI